MKPAADRVKPSSHSFATPRQALLDFRLRTMEKRRSILDIAAFLLFFQAKVLEDLDPFVGRLPPAGNQGFRVSGVRVEYMWTLKQ